MTSQEIKQAFAQEGIKVRVRAFNNKTRFRICRLQEVPHNDESIQIVANLGLCDCWGKLGGTILQDYEMTANVY